MENNFFVGVVCHGKRPFKQEYKEKMVLYSEDNVNYLDLLSGTYYTTDSSNRDYVEGDSIILTSVSEYRIDYLYLLSKHRQSKIARKKRL